MAKTFQDNALDGKVALISGGTRGINLGIARGFMQAGAKVVVFGRNAERAAAAQARIQRPLQGSDGHCHCCGQQDLDDRQRWRNFSMVSTRQAGLQA